MLRRATLVAQAAALTALASAVSSPAGAQCRLCAAPNTDRVEADQGQAVRLEVETSLNFDRLILMGSGDGTATLLPDGSRATSGAIGEMGARAMVGSATVRGEPGRLVRIDLPGTVTLYSLGGGRVSIDEIKSDLPPAPRLDSAGLLQFRFGGSLRISGDAEGEYRGDVPITVEYL